jgi:hypothetical protein
VTPREEWRGHYERLRHEAKSFGVRAKNFRKDAIECRRRRDWLGALKNDDLASEYRRWRDERADAAKKIKAQWGFR